MFKCLFLAGNEEQPTQSFQLEKIVAPRIFKLGKNYSSYRWHETKSKLPNA
jgi:hypothetical protein